MITRHLRFILAGAWLLAITPLLLGQQTRSSASPKDDSRAVLARAKEVMGFSSARLSVIHYRSVASVEQNYQSERTYPPFFSAMQIKEGWLDAESAIERISSQTVFPASGPSGAQVSLTDAKRAFSLAKDKLNPLARSAMQSRYLNPWNVIADWAAAGDGWFAGRELYRDYPRIVLARLTVDGEQRLFIDSKTGFPVKLDLEEKHYLWGQRHVEYLYSNWTRHGGIVVPGSSFKLADGKTEISQTIGDVEIITHEAAPSLSLPKDPAQSADTVPRFLQPIDPKVVQISVSTYLLSNPGYTELVTKSGDELILFDATQGEARARKDAEALTKIFPGRHKLTVVVTDLAWPHIAGVRYWVANGATIIAHKAAQKFLQAIVDRRWTLSPDLLEQRRKNSKLKFIGIDAPFTIADGAVSVHPIDGIGSEVALMGYIHADRFLWASDYIQTVDEPSTYASEVWTAVKRDKLNPERTAAEHLPLTPWSKIEELQKKVATLTPGP